MRTATELMFAYVAGTAEQTGALVAERETLEPLYFVSIVTAEAFFPDGVAGAFRKRA
jgi:hypothetical protein